MRVAPAVQIDKDTLEALELKVIRYVQDALYQKLFDIIGKDELLNDEPVNLIVQALRDGKIYFDGHYFKPQKKFGVKLAREFQRLGAVLKNGGYKLPDRVGDPTLELIKAEVEYQRTRAQNKLEELAAALLETEDFPEPDITEEMGAVIDSIARSVQGCLGIQYELDAYTRNRMVDQYINDVSRYSKKLLLKSNQELKAYIAAEVGTINLSTKSLGKIIEERFGVTARHARFIAHQEAHMAREKLNQTAAENLGFRHYVWQTVGDYRVRPMGGPNGFMGDNHRRLSGKVFSFDDPPVVDRIKMRRCNPGEDFGCRCTARVILDDKYFEI